MAACFLQKRKRAPSLPDSKGSWLVLAVWVEEAEEGRMQGRFCLLRVALTGRCCQRFWNLWNHRRLLQAWTLQGSLLGMKAGRKTTVKPCTTNTAHSHHASKQMISCSARRFYTNSLNETSGCTRNCKLNFHEAHKCQGQWFCFSLQQTLHSLQEPPSPIKLPLHWVNIKTNHDK